MVSSNYRAGRWKGPGDVVTVNEFSGCDPDDLPAVGDVVLLKTRAHLLLEVRPSPTYPDTVRYTAVICTLDDVPDDVRTFESVASISS